MSVNFGVVSIEALLECLIYILTFVFFLKDGQPFYCRFVLGTFVGNVRRLVSLKCDRNTLELDYLGMQTDKLETCFLVGVSILQDL